MWYLSKWVLYIIVIKYIVYLYTVFYELPGLFVNVNSEIIRNTK